MASNIHLLPGRMRVRLPMIQASPERAAEIQQFLQAVPGISQATPNTLTGNVLIRFDPQTITAEQILQRLMQQGYLSGILGFVQTPVSGAMDHVVIDILADVLVEAGLKLLFGAIF